MSWTDASDPPRDAVSGTVPTSRSSRGVTALLTVLGCAILGAYFVVHAWNAWPVPTRLGRDEETVLLSAREFLHDGVVPAVRGRVGGTMIPLGPLFPMWVGACMRLAGEDPHGTWVLLVAGLGIGILLSGLLLVRATGPRIGIPALALLFADPQLYAEIRWPFFYLHQATPLLIACAAGLIGMNTRASVAWWYLAVVAGGLATPMHAMCWMVVPVVLIMGLASGRTLGLRHLSAGLAVYVVTAWPLFSGLPLITDPAQWAHFLHDRSDPAVLGPAALGADGNVKHALVSIAAWLSMRVPFAAATFSLGALVVGEQLVRSRRVDLTAQVTAVVTSAWFVCFGWPLFRAAHRVHDHYAFPLDLPIALMVGMIVDRFTPRHGVAARVLPVATAAFLLTRLGMAPQQWSISTPVPPWATWQVLDPAYAALARAGVGRLDVDGGSRRVHGTPCAWHDAQWCGGTQWLSITRLGESSADIDVNLALAADGSVEVEAGPRCTLVQDTPGQTTIRRVCASSGPEHVHAVVTMASSGVPAWTDVAHAAGWNVAFCVDGEPGASLCVMDRELAARAPEEADLTVPRVEGDRLLDVFVSPRAWDAKRFGLVAPVFGSVVTPVR